MGCSDGPYFLDMDMKDILDRIADSSANESSHELICRLRDCAHEIEALRSALASRPDAQDDERGAFEAWARTADMPLGMYSATDYADGATQISWDAWQARAAAPSPDREQVGEAILGSPAFALRGLYKLATEYFIDGKPATPDEYIAWQRGIIEALTNSKIPDPKYYGTQDEDGAQHEVKCAYVDGWNGCRASILAKDASPSRECADSNPPFSNCSFRVCDLPGQCRGEGECHHPKDKHPLQCPHGGQCGVGGYCDDCPARSEQAEQQGDGGALTLEQYAEQNMLTLEEAADRWKPPEQPTARDYLDTLTAVLNAIGYTEEFAASHPDLKVSEGVKLFLALQRGAIECQAHIGPDCTECGGTGFWGDSTPATQSYAKPSSAAEGPNER